MDDKDRTVTPRQAIDFLMALAVDFKHRIEKLEAEIKERKEDSVF